MGGIVNVVRTLAPTVPEKYRDIITYHANCEVKEDYAVLAHTAIELVVLQLEKENITQLYPVKIIMTRDGRVEIDGGGNYLGEHYSFCVFPINTWETYKIPHVLIVATYIEELVHHFWRTTDEVFAKEKTVEIMKIKIPELTLRKLYGDRYNYDECGNLIDDELLHT